MKWLGALFGVFLLSTPFAAQASSGYGNHFASRSFRYGYVEQIRKMFVDSDQAKSYMEENDVEAKARFLHFRARAEGAVAAARKAGLPVQDWDPALTAFPLPTAAAVSRIDRAVFPLNLVLDVSKPDAHAKETFELSFAKRPSPVALAALKERLGKLARAKPPSLSTDERRAWVSDAGFQAPLAATAIEDTFGVYVGTTIEVLPEDAPRLLKSFEKRLEAVLPKLRSHFGREGVHAELGLTAPLGKLPEALAAKKRAVPAVFNPWGPLSDSFARARDDAGAVSTIVLIAPGKHEWSKLSPPLNTWLEEANLDPKRRAAEAEAERLTEDER